MKEKNKNKNRVKALLFILALTYFTFITGEFFLAVSLLAMIFVHENGHLWAARRKGFKTRGIVFLPIGGVAFVEGLEKADRDDEAFIAIMGPIWGLAFSFIFVVIYHFTGFFEFLKIGGILCLVNLLNMLPLNPLDGGRISKSIIFSMNRKLGLFSMCCMIAMALFMAIWWHLYIFYLVAFFCCIDFVDERNKNFSDYEMGKIVGKQGWEAIKNQGMNIIVEKPKKKSMSYPKMFLYTLISCVIFVVASIPIVTWADQDKSQSNTEEVIDK